MKTNKNNSYWRLGGDILMDATARVFVHVFLPWIQLKGIVRD